jgi:type IV secretory pathway VirB2 component (pilin)
MRIFSTDNYIFSQGDDEGYPGQQSDEKFRQYSTTSSTEAPPKIEQIFNGVDEVLDYLLPIATILAVIFIIMGGYMWMSSAGNPEKVKQAQGTLTWAIIGLVFVVLAALLVKVLIDYIIGM